MCYNDGRCAHKNTGSSYLETLNLYPLSIIHYLLLLLIIIFIITIIIIIDGLYFPRLVNCFLLFYYLIYRARTFEFVTLQHQCICRVLKLPALSYIITNLPI